MPTDILLPILGESINEAVILRWLKQTGDPVKRGEPIAELETAKATLELECPDNGVLEAILVGEGETVITGQHLAVVSRPGDLPREPVSSSTEPLPLSNQEVAPAPIVQEPAARSERRVSPAARKMARELGVPIEQVSASAPGARITSQDVEHYAALHPAGQQSRAQVPSHRIEMSEVRKMTARRMTESAQNIPQYSVSIDVEMEPFNQVLSAARERIEASQVKVSVTALLITLTCRAVRKHPLINARYDCERIEVMDTINLAVAMQTPSGLVAPVIYHAEELSLIAICRRLAELTGRARQGSLTLEDISNSTFTFSNLGMFGITQFTPLINPPQAAILGVGAIRPVVFPMQGNGVCIRPGLSFTLTADHRVLDGADSAEFLVTLKNEIEHCDSSPTIDLDEPR